jgi:hypothetical protein
MAQRPRSLLQVLSEIKQWRPGVSLWEVDPQELIVGSFRPLEDPAAVRHWTVKDLIKTVDLDYAEMPEEARQEFNETEYIWGYTGDGLVVVSSIDRENGIQTKFIESRGPVIRKLM